MVKTSSSKVYAGRSVQPASQQGEVKDLNIIIKADVQGSVEAVKQSLEKLSNDEVQRARASTAAWARSPRTTSCWPRRSTPIIIGFNVRPDATAREAAERDGVDIRLYRVIYQAIEDVEKAMKGMLAPEFTRESSSATRRCATCSRSRVWASSPAATSPTASFSATRRCACSATTWWFTRASSPRLKRFKDDAKEVADGYECGVGLENYNDIKEGDVIECFVMEEIPR